MLAQKWWIHFLLWSKLKSCYDWKYVVKSHLSKNWNSISKRVWPQFLTCCNETPTQNSGTNYPNRFQFFKTPNKQHHMFFNFQSDGIFKGVKCKYPGPSEWERGWGQRVNWHTGISCQNFFHSTIMPSWMCVQKSRQAQETIICLFGLLFLSQNWMTLKKPTKIIKI